MKTTLVKISEVKQNPNNPRTIRDDKFERLVTSIKAFPEMLNIRPIVVNTDMVVLGGNMRLKACREAGLKQVPIIVADELTEAQQREFIIKDNVSGGDWDWALLSNDWDTDQLEDWGLDVPEFETEQHLEAVEDDYEVPDEIQTDIVLGDLFEIGQHRLLCGSATDISSWEKLNIKPNTVCFTSPPYNAGSSAKLTGNKFMSKKGNFYETHDDKQDSTSYSELIQESLSNAIAFCDGIAFNVQPLAGNKHELIDWLANNKGSFVDIITWDKGQSQPAMAEGVLNSRFEWICIFSRENNSRHIPLSSWRGTMNNVYNAPAQRANEFSKVHAATFPIHLPSYIISELMNKCTGVIDCFMGTGTTMVAAHQLGRASYGTELDPKYCQVIIDRMLKLDPTLEVKRNGQAYVKQRQNSDAEA